ncbi:MAG: hypothetical protein KAS30_00720, partial [Candidatus Diapherotrites archaeon]|nr:hypothetical protein [Candidatus Diapherotrites archaeon]
MGYSGFEGYREIKPINELDIVLKAPPSKAHSLRAIFISSLVEGKTRILNPLMGDDQKFALESIRCLGSEVVIEDDSITVFREGELKLPKEPIFVGESGVSARFLPSIVSTAPIGFAVIDGSKRMQTGRPITVLIDALK